MFFTDVDNSTIVENLDEKSPIASRSVKYEENSNENINAKFQAIESILKDIQMKSNKSRLVIQFLRNPPYVSSNFIFNQKYISTYLINILF